MASCRLQPRTCAAPDRERGKIAHHSQEMEYRWTQPAFAWLALLVGLGVSRSLACQGPPAISLASAPSPSTLRMAERLERLAREARPDRNPFLNRGRAAIYRNLLAQGLSTRDEAETRIHMALETLRAGDSQAAIEDLNRAEAAVEKLTGEDRDVLRWLVQQFLAVASLRLGEQENCIAHHTSDSCIFPIRGSGIHGLERGSRGAIAHLTAALRQRPDDLGSVWLLNLAYMTLGEYPGRVPNQWLIPPAVFESEHDIHRFRDVAPTCGLAVTGLAGGAVLEDLDGDGLLDVMCSSWGSRDPIRCFRNEGNGLFTERTLEAGLTGLTGGLNLCHADYDNDGDADVLVLRGAWFHSEGHHPNSLLRNDGKGRFEDITEEAGLLSFHPTQTAAWADYDSDGWLDLFVGNESDADEKHPCELFHNDGDGKFTECSALSGVANIGFVKGVAWGDYDNDGRPDLYLSRLGEPNVLYRSGGPRPSREAVPDGKKPPGPTWTFEDVTARAGVAEPLQSFPCWFFDHDNDGWLDLFVAGYGWKSSAADVAADYLGKPSEGAKPRLYRNQGNGTFADVTRSMRVDKVLITMGCNFGDLDNDGWLDFYAGTGEPDLSALMPNRMFRSFEGEFFQDVTTSGGFGHVQKGHGIAFGDVDQDGDQDIYAVFGGAYEGDTFRRALFENPGHGNHWITLRLEGVRSNRSAIGARIEVKVPHGRGVRSIHATVSTGGSFGSASLQQEIGLGPATSIQSIKVRWPAPDGTQVFENVPVDRVVHLREGDPVPRVLEARRFVLGGKREG